jgi:UDP-hydrolysing UDP-N-acetyl-D-glucosamine 2-epimerase
MSRRIAVATTARSDYSPLYWVLHELREAGVDFGLLVGGAHLESRHGRTIDEIRRDGWPVWATIPGAGGEDAIATATADGQLMAGFAAAFTDRRPDVVVGLGDRHELLAVALAATLCRVPIVHISGGDVTAGVWDDAVRHAVSKLSHWHFPANAIAAARLRQMGEADERLHVVGDPAVDHFVRGQAATGAELADVCGFGPDARTLVVTYHPPTGNPERLEPELSALLTALRQHDGGVVLTGPAPEPGHVRIRSAWEQLAARRPQTVFVESLGGYRYRGLLRLAGAMLGNSSSGLIEAACVPLPAINVGDRQAGRERGGNVLDVAGDPAAVIAALQRALDPDFRRSLRADDQPYGDGWAARRIVASLLQLPDRQTLLAKPFVDRPIAAEAPPCR